MKFRGQYFRTAGVFLSILNIFSLLQRLVINSLGPTVLGSISTTAEDRAKLATLKLELDTLHLIQQQATSQPKKSSGCFASHALSCTDLEAMISEQERVLAESRVRPLTISCQVC